MTTPATVTPKVKPQAKPKGQQPKGQQPKGPQPAFQPGTQVRFKRPPTPLGWGFTYRPSTGIAIRSEGAGEPLEVTLVRWEDDGSHKLCWAADLEIVPAEPAKK